MRKAFRFTDEDEIKWSELKDRYKLTSDTDLMRFILTNHWSAPAKNFSEATPNIDDIEYAPVDNNYLKNERNMLKEKAAQSISNLQGTVGSQLLEQIVQKNPAEEVEYPPMAEMRPPNPLDFEGIDIIPTYE